MPSSDCILWRGPRNTDGHGWLYFDGRCMYAHRAVYLLYHGPIPRGHEIHHECENKLCVNPAHLVAVTRREHVARHGQNLKAARVSGDLRAGKTHCKRGHEFSTENTEPNTGGGRRCRTCERERKRRSYLCSIAKL